MKKLLLAAGLIMAASSVFAETIISTGSGSDQNQACAEAQQSSGTRNRCDCEQRGQIFICQVLTSGNLDSGSAVDGAMNGTRQYLREKAACNPDKEYCPPKTNGGPGVRG
jgi:hypothetical protein